MTTTDLSPRVFSLWTRFAALAAAGKLPRWVPVLRLAGWERSINGTDGPWVGPRGHAVLTYTHLDAALWLIVQFVAWDMKQGRGELLVRKDASTASVAWYYANRTDWIADAEQVMERLEDA